MADDERIGSERDQNDESTARGRRDERHARDYWGTDGHGPYSGHFEGYGRGGALDLGRGGFAARGREPRRAPDERRLDAKPDRADER